MNDDLEAIVTQHILGAPLAQPSTGWYGWYGWYRSQGRHVECGDSSPLWIRY